MTTKTYEILVDRLPELETSIKLLNKKALKLKLAPITIEKGVVRATIEKDPANGHEIEVIRMTIVLTGERPVLNGWSFVALLQHEAGGTIIKALPDVAEGTLKKYRNAKPGCDHCEMARRRNDTFVVQQGENGATKQVGRNCLRDFLGHADPHACAAYAELLMVAGELCDEAGSADFWGEGGSSFVPRTIGMDRFLGIVVAAIRESGWLSRTKARDQGRDMEATAERALAEAFRKGDKPVVKGIVPDDFVEAARYLKFVSEKFDASNPEELSDYEHNLRVAVLTGYVTSKTSGIAASLVVYAQRELAKLAELDAVARGERKHVGTIGERTTLVLKLMGQHSFDTAFGTSTWVNFADETGSRLCWKASGYPQAHVIQQAETRHGYAGPEEWPETLVEERMIIGESYEVTGTIEKHVVNKRDGVTPETILKRCFVAAVGVGAWQEVQKVKAKEAKKIAAREKRAAAKKATETGVPETPGPLFAQVEAA